MGNCWHLAAAMKRYINYSDNNMHTYIHTSMYIHHTCMYMCMDMCTHVHVYMHHFLYTHTCCVYPVHIWLIDTCTQLTCTYVPLQVFKFLVCVLNGLIPAELWGSSENKMCFFNHILYTVIVHTPGGGSPLVMNSINLCHQHSISISLSDRYLIFHHVP